MRPTVEALTPACSAILRVLQWVRPFGLLSNVVTRIDSTSASDRVRGAPGLGSSSSASTRPTLNRCRHLPTVTFEQRSFAATATFDSPRVLLRTILARKATCRFVRARLASRSSSTRSAAVTSNLALGRPVLAMPPNTSQPTHYLKLFQTQGTRDEGRGPRHPDRPLPAGGGRVKSGPPAGARRAGRTRSGRSDCAGRRSPSAGAPEALRGRSAGETPCVAPRETAATDESCRCSSPAASPGRRRARREGCSPCSLSVPRPGRRCAPPRASRGPSRPCRPRLRR